MRTRRRTYTEVTPPSTVNPIVPVSGTKRRKLRSCTAKAKGYRTGLWDLDIPLNLLQGILSRLGLKANIRASSVCKAWFESAVSVRNLKPCPWLLCGKFKIKSPSASPYILVNPLRSPSQTYKLDFPELNDHAICCSRDGWVLVRSYSHKYALFLNPFTKNHFYLPQGEFTYTDNSLAFSAAPTSASCFVISYTHLYFMNTVAISTWRPGQTAWTVHRFRNCDPYRRWKRCVFSNGMFYLLSSCGYLGVFDPCQTSWNILPVKPCPALSPLELHTPELMTEHEGDIFVLYTRKNKSPTVLKLNLDQNVWEEKKDLGGLTVFVSLPTTFIRVGLSPEERNKIYPSFTTAYKLHGMYYSLGDGKSAYPLGDTFFYFNFAWVEPPKNLNLL